MLAKLREAQKKHSAELDKAWEAHTKAEDELREVRREQKHERQQAKHADDDNELAADTFQKMGEAKLRLALTLRQKTASRRQATAFRQTAAGPAAGPP